MNEKVSMLKNIWILSGILFGISFLICYFGNLIIGQSIYYCAGILSAIVVAYIYTSKFKEIMPKDTRIKIVSIYTIIQIMIVIILVTKQFKDLISSLMLFVIPFMIVQAVLMSFTLRFSGEKYLKRYSKIAPKQRSS